MLNSPLVLSCALPNPGYTLAKPLHPIAGLSQLVVLLPLGVVHREPGQKDSLLQHLLSARWEPPYQ